MRRSFFSLMMVLACAPQESPSETPKAPETAGSATVVGTVDGQQITAAELQNRVDAQVAQFRVAGRKVTATFEQNTRRAIFQFLVDQELVAQEGQRQGLAITDEELDQAIATFKDRFGSPAGFVKYLKTIQRTETEWREDHRIACSGIACSIKWWVRWLLRTKKSEPISTSSLIVSWRKSR